MDAEAHAELAAIRDLVSTSTISPESKHSVAWCLDKLSPLYGQFYQTYDSRISQEIQRLEQGILGKLGKEPRASRDAKTVAKEVQSQLQTLHERFGLENVDPKPRRAARAE